MSRKTLQSLALTLCLTLSLSQVIWNEPADWNHGLPSSIQVYQTNSSYTAGVNMTAAYCKIDLSDPDLEFRVVSSSGADLKTPLQYMEESEQYVYMVANGGYFNMILNQSISLIVQDGQEVASNAEIVNQTYNGHSVPYYPTKGAFGVHADGTPEVAWVYNLNNNFSQLYAYPEPAPICFGCPPRFMPNANFPAGGRFWNVTEAIGAGPVLMKDGAVNVTSDQELFFKLSSDVRNPRTAVCVTHNKELIIMVVDGRYELSGGLLLQELAGLMQELDCRDALNFDGGGSTAMIVNGYLTNRPSDASGMRPVTSAVMLVSKSKPYPRSKTTQSEEVKVDYI